MANELDEVTGPVNGAGRDINVIEKQLPVRVGWGSTLFEIVLWCLFIVPGLIFLFMKIGAKNYFQQLQQENPDAIAEMSPTSQEMMQRWLAALEQQNTQFGENAEIGRTGVEGVSG